MHGRDSVATVMIDIKEGGTVNIFSDENISLGEVTALDDIPFGNKIALVDIQKGDKVIKYGSEIGEATQNIHKGELVHVHNVKSLVVDIPPSFKSEIMRQMNITRRNE